MQISGQFYNLESRIHQFTAGQSDYDFYLDEKNSYTGALPYLIKKWERELKKKKDHLGLVEGASSYLALLQNSDFLLLQNNDNLILQNG